MVIIKSRIAETVTQKRTFLHISEHFVWTVLGLVDLFKIFLNRFVHMSALIALSSEASISWSLQ